MIGPLVGTGPELHFGLSGDERNRDGPVACGPMELGDRMPSIALRTPDGGDATLEQYLDRPRVVAMPRYYG